MSSKTNSNVAPLMAFLLWNALSHMTTRAKEFSVQAWRWMATREHYEVMLGNWRSALSRQLTNGIENIGVSLFELIIIIFIVGALIGNVANATTGITIAHTGFTPNANLTASPGAVPLTQLYPLVFVAIGLLTAFEYFKHTKG